MGSGFGEMLAAPGGGCEAVGLFEGGGEVVGGMKAEAVGQGGEGVGGGAEKAAGFF